MPKAPKLPTQRKNWRLRWETQRPGHTCPFLGQARRTQNPARHPAVRLLSSAVRKRNLGLVTGEGECAPRDAWGPRAASAAAPTRCPRVWGPGVLPLPDAEALTARHLLPTHPGPQTRPLRVVFLVPKVKTLSRKRQLIIYPLKSFTHRSMFLVSVISTRPPCNCFGKKI